jgi:hypothetical protein
MPVPPEVQGQQLLPRRADRIALAHQHFIALWRAPSHAASTAPILEGRGEGLRGLRIILGPFAGDAAATGCAS